MRGVDEAAPVSLHSRVMTGKAHDAAGGAVLRAGLGYRLYRALVCTPLMWVSTILFGSLAVVLLFILPPRAVSWLCGAQWARLNAFLIPVRVKVRGREHVDPRQSYVIVSNHQSHVDVFVLYGWIGVDFKWVMKQELRRVPGLGIACERLGHVFIDRSNREAALRSINQAKSRIVDGTSVLFFPEGTRSRDGRLGSFKKGAFRMAVDLELPILPVTITGTRDILRPDSRDLRPGRATLTFHPPIAVDPSREGEPDRLLVAARDAINAGLVQAER